MHLSRKPSSEGVGPRLAYISRASPMDWHIVAQKLRFKTFPCKFGVLRFGPLVQSDCENDFCRLMMIRDCTGLVDQISSQTSMSRQSIERMGGEKWAIMELLVNLRMCDNKLKR